MQFRKINSIEPVVAYLAKTISTQLKSGKPVLWLLPGGSAIEVVVAAGKLLVKEPDLTKLTLSLTDERYGQVGHKDSNWQQLKQAGFSLSGAKLRPVLTGQNFKVTTQKFSKMLQTELNEKAYALGFFGLGADGHTAGILPDSPALQSKSLATNYEAADFKRITITASVIAQLDEAVVYALGQAKQPVLDLLEKDLSSAAQPAQILKQVPKLTIFNDYKGKLD